VRRVAFDCIRAEGHANVRAAHKTTLEITKEDWLTPRGDCIVGIRASKGARDLNQDVKDLIRTEGSTVILALVSEHYCDFVVARGSPALTLSDPNRIIVRKSGYSCPATVGILSDKAAADLNRKLVEDLRNGSKLLACLIVITTT